MTRTEENFTSEYLLKQYLNPWDSPKDKATKLL